MTPEHATRHRPQQGCNVLHGLWANTGLAYARGNGLSAGRLSRLLHGDDQHVVTVRAEVSRLRRAVGALVSTNPYRLAGGAFRELTHG
jgi:hypothetical protein